MKFQLFKLFINEFRKRKKKTSLITFAIAWGALSLLLMMAFGRGLTNQFEAGFKGLGVDLIGFYTGRTTVTYNGLPKGRRIFLYAEDAELIRKLIPEVKNICAEAYEMFSISRDEKNTNQQVHGVNASFEEMRSTYPLQGGRFVNSDDEKYCRRVTFLGWGLADKLFGKVDPIGKVISINRTPFTVIGVMKKKLQSSYYSGIDYECAYIPLSTYLKMNSRPIVDVLLVQPSDKIYSKLVERRIKEILGKKYRFSPDDNYALNAENTIEASEMASNIFLGIEIFLSVVGGLTLFIAAVGVTNLMYAVVRERTREIGVKMAIGAKRRHIVTQFLMEALLIFLKGTFWGALISFNLVSLVRCIPLDYNVTSLQSYFLRPVFSFDTLFIFLVIMSIFVFFSGIFPALRASKLNPVDALRYE